MIADPKTYTDDKNNEITIGLGALAFADRVVEFKVGDPAPTEPYRNAQAALGEPDYHLSDKRQWSNHVGVYPSIFDRWTRC